MDEALATPRPSTLSDKEFHAESVQRRVLPCKEWEVLNIEAEELHVGGKLQVYEHISASKYLSVRISDGMVVFTPTHFIGQIPLNDHIVLEVAPRFDVSNLVRLLRIAQHSPVPLERFVRTYVVNHEHLPSIFDEITAAFLGAVETVARTGLLSTYLMTTKTTSYPRGRILVDSTIRLHHSRGERFRAESVWFDRAVDNASNRLLKYTMWVIDRRLASATSTKGVAKLRTKLNQYYEFFSGVPLDRSRQFLKARDVLDLKRLPSIRGYYIQAIQLAILLVRENSLDLGKKGGIVRASSMLTNLQDAFEDYLRNSLSDNLKNRGASLLVLNGNWARPLGAKKGLFSEEASRPATPDIVVQTAGRANNIPLIVEIKYKETPSRDDVNQAIAYGVSYGCPVVVLAHVRQLGKDPHLQYEGSLGGMKLYRYAYDLAGDLGGEEKLFAKEMEKLALRGALQ